MLMSSLGLLVMPSATDTVIENTRVEERAATVPATTWDDQTTDNKMRNKNSSIHVPYKSFYSKLVYTKHLSRQFPWNCPVMSNIYVTWEEENQVDVTQ